MQNRQELLKEAYQRGILPPEQKAAFEEAVNRKLIEFPQDKLSGESKGFFSRVGEDVGKRIEMGREASRAFVRGEQGFPETVFQTTGKVVAGAAGDVISEGIRSAASGVASVTPEAIKAPVSQAFEATKDAIVNSAIGKAGIEAAKKGISAYDSWAKENPRFARNLESAVNIATILPAGKGASAVASEAVTPALNIAGKGIEKAGDVLYQSGEKSFKANREKFLQELITPKATPTIAAERFARSKETGILRNRVVTPTPQESSVMDTLSELPVTKNKSLLANYNIIENAKNEEAQNLITKLKDNDIAISRKEINQILTKTLDDLKQNPYITGDAETSASRVIDGMMKIIGDGEQTASGLLEARKNFDSWVKSQRGKGVFDPQRDSTVTTAVQGVRQAINDLVESKVPDVGYRASLAKQSNLYRALEAIQTKGAYEGSNVFKRGAQKVADLIPVKGAIQKATVITAGGAGAALAPAATGGALAIYGLYKGAANPTLRKGVGRAIKSTGSIIGNATRAGKK